MTTRSVFNRSLFILSLLSACLLSLSGCDLLEQLAAEGALAQETEPTGSNGTTSNDDDDDDDDDSLCNDDDDDDDDDSPNTPPWTPPPAPADCEEGETLWDTVTLRTQEDAEDFAAVYTVARTIVIEGQQLTNLDALACLERVNSLTAIDTALERVELPSATRVMNVLFEENAQLREISLPRAEEVDGVTLVSNPQLTRVSAPAANSTLFRTWLEDNEALTEVDFRSVTEGRGVVSRENPSLRRFDMANLVETGSIEFSDTGLEGILDLSSLEVLGGHLQFRRNDSLREVRLEGLVETGQEIVFDDHSSLQTIRLDSLETASTNTVFRDNRQLLEIHLPELTYQGQSLTISGNDSLANVRIPSLQSVGDPDTSGYLRSTLHIENNPQVSELGFDSLVAVGCRLRIVNSDEITNLDGFSSLRIVRGNLRLADNRMLRDITGLYGLESIGMAASPIGPDAGNFLVRDNPRLPIEQAEELAHDIVGEDNIGGDIILIGVPFGGEF